MGVEPFLVGSRRRLRRRPAPGAPLCEECKRRTTITSEVLRANGFNVGLDLEAYEPVGCARCGGSGYKGRIGLYEVMPVTDTIRQLAVAREPAETIADAAVHEGMMRLREDGLEKVRRGLTRSPRSPASPAPAELSAPLQSGRPPADVGGGMNLYFADILLKVVEHKASDLHISSGAPPTIRVREPAGATRGPTEPDAHRHA